MALTINSIRNSRIRSIFGRVLGLDKNDCVVGPRAMIHEIEDITTTDATTASQYAVTRVSGLSSTQGPVQHNLPVPIPGVYKDIILDCTSTASCQFLTTPNGAGVYIASLGSTGNAVNLLGPSARVRLLGITSTIWSVVSEGLYSSTAMAKTVSYTTST